MQILEVIKNRGINLQELEECLQGKETGDLSLNLTVEAESAMSEPSSVIDSVRC